MIEAQASGLPCVVSEVITEEVEITDHIIRLPFDIEMWSMQLLNYRNVARKDTQMMLLDAGYDIRRQIKVIEKFIFLLHLNS